MNYQYVFINSTIAVGRWVLQSCCFSSVSPTAAEEYGYLFRSNSGIMAAVKTLDASNSSMEVAAWANNVELKAIPKQILWASEWSDRWQKEGKQLAAQLPNATFHSHHGSRWPQVPFLNCCNCSPFSYSSYQLSISVQPPVVFKSYKLLELCVKFLKEKRNRGFQSFFEKTFY